MASHQGWNELHGVKSVQKIDESLCKSQDFEDLRDRWCKETMKVPPPRKSGAPDSQPAGMTPDQETVWGEQRKHENRWIYHPEIDGCEPAPEPLY